MIRVHLPLLYTESPHAIRTKLENGEGRSVGREGGGMRDKG
jgi:hypothetical protein